MLGSRARVCDADLATVRTVFETNVLGVIAVANMLGGRRTVAFVCEHT
jgi:hypothetical protein